MYFCGLIAIHTLQSAEKCIFFDFSYRNIWSYEKKVVLLQAFSRVIWVMCLRVHSKKHGIFINKIN